MASKVWQRFGNVSNYVEPFFGSGAMLLGRPQPFDGVETVNDKDGFICNFWRAVQAVPDEVANWADNPVNENDLHARHHWLVERKDSLGPKLEGDPDFYDAKIAGWWCWGINSWIGGGWCSGAGPWSVQEVDGFKQLVKGSAGQGVNRKLVHLSDAGQGVNRKLVHLSDAGRGVNRQLVHLGNAGQGVKSWMNELAERLRRVRVCCGDWRRVTGGKSGNALQLFFAGGNTCAIFLDPPYSTEAGRDMTLYREDCGNVAHDVRRWAIEHGDDPRLRIALCGYDGEHEMPADWSVLEWKAVGGYSNQSDESNGKENCKRERIWFSKHCEKPNQGELFK